MTKVRTDHQIALESSRGTSMNPHHAREYFKIFAPSSSLRRRVAYSLAIVRLILVPVIFLAIYYLFEMGWIVDRIVNTDAPASSLAEQASIEMLQARRAERNYFLLRDPAYVQTNHEAVSKVIQILHDIQNLEPQEQDSTTKALNDLTAYQQRFAAAVTEMNQPGAAPADRVQAVVRDYENDLNDLLKGTKDNRREQLVDELRRRVGSFDTQITSTIQTENPTLANLSKDLQAISQDFLTLTFRIGNPKLESGSTGSPTGKPPHPPGRMGARHGLRLHFPFQCLGELCIASPGCKPVGPIERSRGSSGRRQ